MKTSNRRMPLESFQPDPRPPSGKGWCLTGELIAKSLVHPRVVKIVSRVPKTKKP